MNLQEQFDSLLNRIWTDQGNRWKNRACSGLRILICSGRELASGELSLRAMSLVYSTLLSLVPLLALAFSILKGLGVHNRIEPMLGAMLEPLGPAAGKLTSTVIGFVDNVKIGVLGSIGIALLFYTVLSMIQKVESSFNFIWKIPRQRPLTQRVSEYLVVLLLGPLALTLVLGATASLSSSHLAENLLANAVIGPSVYWAGRILPYLLIVMIFSFLFMLVPNTRVRWPAAFIGGLISGLLWQSAAWIFANFVASSSNYNAVYSSFAIVILLLIWIYLAWLILLTGCQIAFFVQHPEYLTRHRRRGQLCGEARDLLILNLMSIVQRRFSAGQAALKPAELARLCTSPPDLANPLINDLVDTGLLAETAQGGLLPAQDPNGMTLSSLLDRANYSLLQARPSSADDHSQALVARLAAARADILGGMTLADLDPGAQEAAAKDHRL